MTFATNINKELLEMTIQDCKDNPGLYCIIACKTLEQLELLKKNIPSNCHKMRNFIEQKFENNSFLLIILSNCIRGHKAHRVYYDETEDKELIYCVIQPCGHLIYNRI